MSDDVQKANEAFQAGDFDKAVDLYKAALPSVNEQQRHLIHSNIGASLHKESAHPLVLAPLA